MKKALAAYLTPAECRAKALELHGRAIKAGSSQDAAKFRSMARDWEEVARALVVNDGAAETADQSSTDRYSE